MKTISTMKPPPFKVIILSGSDAEIVFAENIRRPNVLYEYDMYILSVPYRAGLENDVKNNYDAWLKKAKARGAEPVYTAFQQLQQDLTDLQLTDIKTQQDLTELELTLLEG